MLSFGSQIRKRVKELHVLGDKLPQVLSDCVESAATEAVKAAVQNTPPNTGNIAGDEIVQMYIRDRFSSVTRPVKELKDFARIHLEPGETRTVEFSVTPDKLMFLDKDLRPVVEPGEFIVMVGPSSDDRDLHTASFFVR